MSRRGGRRLGGRKLTESLEMKPFDDYLAFTSGENARRGIFLVRCEFSGDEFKDKIKNGYCTLYFFNIFMLLNSDGLSGRRKALIRSGKEEKFY